EYGCGKLIVVKPDVTITYLADLPKPIEDSSKKQPSIDKIFAGEVSLKNGRFTYVTQKKGTKSTIHLNGGNFVLTDWEYRPQDKQDENRILFAKNAVFRFRQMSYRPEKSLYTLKTKAIYFEPL